MTHQNSNPPIIVSVRILLRFQEEMMVQKDPIKLEKMMAWREEKKQIKIG